MSSDEILERPQLSAWRRAAVSLISQPDATNDGPVRLAVAAALSGAAVLFFRQQALPELVAAVVGALAIVLGLYLGYHRIGLRPTGRLWPGFSRGLATALLLFCLCPPGLPPSLMLVLAALAVLVDGALRGLVVPLAIGGVMVAWPLAWLWHVQAGADFLAPFQLRSQLDPISLWTRFQLELDPARLYAGNVAGPLGATSFGLVGIGFLVLAFLRRASWAFVLAFYAPIAVVMAVTHNSLPVYLINGSALLWAGIVGGETRRLPLSSAWRAGAGAAAGCLGAYLLLRGGGPESYGFAMIGAALLVSLFQLFGLSGSPAVVSAAHSEREKPAMTGAASIPQLVAMIVFAPLGLLLVWRDQSLPPSQRRLLGALGLALYIVVLSGALFWFWELRLPA
ncbi:MAG TPA: RnfABCDGE type electron transport complex subunit D [Candidatus Solibacter sp.]|nr:RnfABCDGE type electron transport complex subunit D [Candidatus Solibacter sp.]